MDAARETIMLAERTEKLECSGIEPSNMDTLIHEIRQLMNNRQESVCVAGKYENSADSRGSEREDQEQRRRRNDCRKCGLDKGMDFNEKCKVKLDFDRKLLSMCDDVIVASINTTENGLARVCRETSIEPGHMMSVPVKLSRRKNDDIVLLEPSPYVQSCMLMGAKCLVTVKKNQALINIVNPTKEVKILQKNKVLAVVHNVEKDQIYSLDTPCDFEPTQVNSAGLTSNDSKLNEPKVNFDLSKSCVDENEKLQLQCLLEKNKDIFSTDMNNIGSASSYLHTIENETRR
ncbi:hypothetical protein ACF0H5_003286 [Mactra antiquata]